MGNSFFENLQSSGASTPTGEFIRIVGGIDPNGKVRYSQMDLTGGLEIAPGDAYRTGHDYFRTIQPTRLLEVKQLSGKDTVYTYEALTAGGTSTFLTNEGCVRLSCTTASGDKVIRQSKYIPYQTGRAIFAQTTANIGAAKTNVRQRIGLFDASNGAFFEQTSAGISVVTRSSTSGAPVDSAVAQASWNIDTLNGSGVSGLTLDTSKIQRWIVLMTWPGSVKFGVQIGDRLVYCHQVNNNNLDTTAWGSSAVLPIRHEIENTGTAASGTDFKQFSYAAYSEGAFNPNQLEAAENLAAARTVAGGGTLPLISVRLKSTNLKAILAPMAFSLIQTGTARTLAVNINIGGTITGGAWAAASTHAESNVTGTAISGGFDVFTSLDATSSGLSVLDFSTALYASADIAGTADTITIWVLNLNGASSATILSTLRWKEIF